MSEKSKYNFKCLEQKCTTKACHIREQVTVTLGDLGRWTTQGYLMNILPGVSLKMPTTEDEGIVLEMVRKPLEEKPESTCCIFYNEKANGCEIRYSRPISCRTYPLEFNGEKYYLSGKDCPGVGHGEISKEVLQEARNLAEQEYKERTETDATLPAIYSIIMTELIRQSAEAMKKRSEDEKKEQDTSKSEKSDENPTTENGKDTE
ncbi:MAG: YkgJ family cysteine cluster protein [Candidatus Odinarchaeota archaeon]